MLRVVCVRFVTNQIHAGVNAATGGQREAAVLARAAHLVADGGAVDPARRAQAALGGVCHVGLECCLLLSALSPRVRAEASQVVLMAGVADVRRRAPRAHR